MLEALALLIGLFVVDLAAKADAPPTIEYSLAPVFRHDALQSVAVDVKLMADASGTTVIELPDEFGGQKAHYHYLSALRVSNGSLVETTPATRTIHSAPNARLTIHYTVRGAYTDEPTSADQNLYRGPVMRPTWFAALGDFFILQPRGRDNENATIRWHGWPRGWVTASSEDGRGAHLDDLVEAAYMAGRDVELRTQPIEGGMLRLVSHGRFPWSVDAYAARLAATVSAQRRFWGDQSGDYQVSLIGLLAAPGNSSAGGTGRAHGFVQYTSPDTPEPDLLKILAHEHMHNWIPHQIGEVLEGDQERSLYWLSEGFTDFYRDRTLLRAQLWTVQQFADDLSHVLTRLASSPVRNAPNTRIVADFWHDPAVSQLAYDRGHLFAHLLDNTLKKAGHHGLDDVMFAMRARWAGSPATSKPKLDANLMTTLDAIGFDARPLIRRYIEEGRTIELPAELFGDCARLDSGTIAAFDPGYDIAQTTQTGVVSGVRPDGPAYAAGLRDGMKRLARLSGEMGNSSVAFSFRLLDGNQERTVTWSPQGAATNPVQQIHLAAALTPMRLDACADSMSR